MKNPMAYSFLTNSLLAHLKYARDRYRDQSYAEEPRESSKKHAELALSSALLASFSCRLTGPVVFPLAKAGALTMEALRRSLEQSSVPMEDCFDPVLFQHIRLWALYVGAIWEWDRGIYRLDRSWFIPRLQVLVSELELTCWAELIAICDGFLYVNGDQVHISVWFLGMDSPENLSWAGAGRYQQSSNQFLSGLLFDREGYS